MNTGMKAPEGMGIVVETADIQNCSTKTGSKQDQFQSRWVSIKTMNNLQQMQTEEGRYLHDEEEEEDDKDTDTRVKPGGRAAEARRSREP